MSFEVANICLIITSLQFIFSSLLPLVPSQHQMLITGEIGKNYISTSKIIITNLLWHILELPGMQTLYCGSFNFWKK